MGGALSCTSIGDRYKGHLDYSVTIKPSDDVDKVSLASFHQVYSAPATLKSDLTGGQDKADLVGGMDVPNGYKVNNNNEGRTKLDMNSKKAGHGDSGTSPWKFWRRLSARSTRTEHKPIGRKERPEIVLLEKPDPSQSSDDLSAPKPPQPTAPSSGPLPDVVEKASGLPRFSSSAVPPPKPPRLFLFRAPSTVSRHSTENENVPDPLYMNSAELKPQIHHTTFESSRANSIIRAGKPGDMGENNNLIEQTSKNEEQKREAVEQKREAVVCGVFPKDTSSATFSPSSSDASSTYSSTKGIPHPSHFNSVPRKPKIKTPELNSKRPGRSRRRSSDKGEMTRQKHIMNSVSELLRQRLDPYPMLDQLKRSGILTNLDVQSFLGHHDRKSVCEGIVGLVGDGTPDVLPLFCDVLGNSGNCTEISEVLQVMREVDRIIYDVTCNTNCETTVLAEEKNLNYDIGYLAPDHSLKPLVELERVRASSDKRLSKTSSRNSAYSLLEGGDSDSSKNGDNGVFPGLIMMSICITGHNLSGQRAEALADLIRNHNCICELRLGKTLLFGEDIHVLAKALEDNSTIHSLDLRLNTIEYTGALAVAELLQKTKTLRLLNLSSCSLDLKSIKTIMTAMSTNKSIIDIDLSFLDVTDECCECLRDMFRANTSLQKIRLRSNSLTWSGCYVIAEGLVRNKTLNVFDLSRNTIGDDGVQALAKFLPESSVTDLCLENCSITGAGCDALAEVVTHCKKLKQLDLSSNKLLDAGITKLATALERSSSLQNLGLNMCGVTNDGFSKLLDVLEKNTSIVHMKLCYNSLGKEFTNPAATSDNLRYRLRIVTSSKPKLRILLWGNSFDEA